MTDVTEKSSDFIKDLGDAARRNPISAALIGMGSYGCSPAANPRQVGPISFKGPAWIAFRMQQRTR